MLADVRASHCTQALRQLERNFSVSYAHKSAHYDRDAISCYLSDSVWLHLSLVARAAGILLIVSHILLIRSMETDLVPSEDIW